MKTVALTLRSPLLRQALQQILTERGYSVAGSASPTADIGIVDAAQWSGNRTDDVVADRIVVVGDTIELKRLTLQQVMAADGVFSFDATSEALLQTLVLVLAGERVIPRELMQSLVRQRSAAISHPPGLSPREDQMVRHLTHGSCNKIIAREVGISEATVKVHLKNLFRKLRVANRTQAALWGKTNLAA